MKTFQQGRMNLTGLKWYLLLGYLFVTSQNFVDGRKLSGEIQFPKSDVKLHESACIYLQVQRDIQCKECENPYLVESKIQNLKAEKNIVKFEFDISNLKPDDYVLQTKVFAFDCKSADDAIRYGDYLNEFAESFQITDGNKENIALNFPVKLYEKGCKHEGYEYKAGDQIKIDCNYCFCGAAGHFGCTLKGCFGKSTSKCEDAKVNGERKNKRRPGTFIPQCEKNGDYSEYQCHGSTGYCWCAHPKSGKEIEGTRTGPGQPRVKCPNQKYLSIPHERKLSGAITFPDDLKRINEAACLHIRVQKNIQCVTYPCVNKFLAEFNMKNLKLENNKVNYKFDISSLKSGDYSLDVKMNSFKCIDASKPMKYGDYFNDIQIPFQIDDKTGNNVKLDFSLRLFEKGCKHEGYEYKAGDQIKIDCNYCFCGAAGYFGCTKKGCFGKSSSKCEDAKVNGERKNKRRPGTFIPQCEKNGDYSEYQCHGSTGYCWCAHPKSGNEIEGTRTGPGQPRAKCPNQKHHTISHRRKLSGSISFPDKVRFYKESCIHVRVQKNIQCVTYPCVNPYLAEYKMNNLRVQNNKVNYEFDISSLKSGDFSLDVKVNSFECRSAKKPMKYGDYFNDMQVSFEINDKTGDKVELDFPVKLFEKGCQYDGYIFKAGDGIKQECNYCTCGASGYFACTLMGCIGESSSKCEDERDRAAQNTKKLIVGHFSPKCKENGDYEEVQCHGSTGICYCVNPKSGREIERTSVPPGSPRPVCPKIERVARKCEPNEVKYEDCNSCICNEYGDLSCTEIDCARGVCYHEGKAYKDGETYTDQCSNKCVCTVTDKDKVGAFACTEIGCSPKSSRAAPAPQPKESKGEPRECQFDNKIYPVGKSFVSEDCSGHCKCNEYGGVECVSLCPPARVQCDDDSSIEEYDEKVNDKCSCKRQRCKPKKDPPQECTFGGKSYPFGKTFIPDNCEGRCNCRDDGGVECVSLCPPSMVNCPAGLDDIESYDYFVNEKCSCKRFRCRSDSKKNVRLAPQPKKLSSTSRLGNCKKEREEAVEKAKRLLGVYIPTCKDNGDYTEKQCHTSANFCWCVHPKTGKKFLDSWKNGLEPKYTCKTQCQLHLKESKPTTNGGIPIIGAYVPTCKQSNNKYEEEQCHPSTGYCWCVNSDTGDKIFGTDRAPGLDRVNCKHECKIDGKSYKLGERFNKGDPCMNCECTLNGEICSLIDCKPPSCKDAVRTPGTCCDYSCPSCDNRLCAAVYAPVCGSNGKTYPNKCVFEGAKCRDNSLSFTPGPCCARICTADYRPVCGSDRKTYGNKCAFGIAKCKDPSLKIERDGVCGCEDDNKGYKIGETYQRNGDPCITCDCRREGPLCRAVSCLKPPCKNPVPKPGTCCEFDCGCDKPCPRHYLPMCGTDSVEYGNNCLFEIAKCKNPKLKLANPGKCSTSRDRPNKKECEFGGKTYQLGEKVDTGNPCEICRCTAQGKVCAIKDCKPPSCRDAVMKPGTCCEYKCPSCDKRACPLIYSPVCGSNGKTYPNKCVFEGAKCYDNSLTFRPGDCCERPCFKIYRPVCGSDQKTYNNKCLFQNAQCKNKDLKIEHPGVCGCKANGKTYKLGEEYQYGDDACTTCRCTINGPSCLAVFCKKPDCANPIKIPGTCCEFECPECDKQLCPRIYGPVCGSNGKTYPNKCEFENAKCLLTSLTMTPGACKKPKPVNVLAVGKLEVKTCKTPLETCFLDPCSKLRCESHPNAVCKTNKCGGCKAEFFLDGKQVECTNSICQEGCTYEYDPQCAKNGKTYANTCDMEYNHCLDNSIEFDHAGKCSDGPPVAPKAPCSDKLAAYPELNLDCTPDGHFSPKQCGNSECWCVNHETGEEIDNTRSSDKISVSCKHSRHGARFAVIGSKGKCHIEQQKYEDLKTNGQPLLGSYKPDCHEDGTFKLKQCNPSSATCWCVDRNTGKEIPGTSAQTFIKNIQCDEQKGKCHIEQQNYEDRKTNGQPLLGSYKPDCHDDGTFKPKQCNPSSATCWCVDRNTGKEIPGTSAQTFIKNIQCDERVGVKDECNGLPLVACTFKPCAQKFCDVDGKRDAVCKENFCGGCNAEFYLGDKKIECEKPGCRLGCTFDYEPMCGSNGKTYDNRCLLETAQCQDNTIFLQHEGGCIDKSKGKCHFLLEEYKRRSANGQPLLGGFKPDCHEDGTFKSKQCNPSTATCLCVDRKTGEEIPGTSAKIFIKNIQCDEKAIAKNCERPCPRIYRPVCANNMKSYANKCLFKNAQCKDNTLRIVTCQKSEKIRACYRLCPYRYRPVCGTNGKTYKNHCKFHIAKCRDPTLKMAFREKCPSCRRGLKKVKCDEDPCKTGFCAAHPNALCYVNRCGSCRAEYSVMGERKTCGKECKNTCAGREKFTVCGTDGKEYKNECELNHQKCLSGGTVQLRHFGTCAQSAT